MCGNYLTVLTFRFLDNCRHLRSTSCDFSNFSDISRLSGIFDTLLKKRSVFIKIDKKGPSNYMVRRPIEQY